VHVFLRRHGFDDAAQLELELPRLPFYRDIWTVLLSRSSAHLPLSVLEDYITYLNFNVAPPAMMGSFIKKLKDDPSLCDTSEVQDFLRRFGVGDKVILRSDFDFFYVISLPGRRSITAKSAHEQYLRLYTTLLWNQTGSLKTLRHVTDILWRFGRKSTVHKFWSRQYKPIVEAIITYVEGIRTKEWQKDPERRPRILPDTLGYRMWLLQYAAQHSPEAESGNCEAHCENFATRVAEFSDAMVGTVYHSKFQQLKDALEYVSGNDRKRVALYLGNISKTQDLLRLELAAGLLASTWGDPPKDEELDKRVDRMRDSWRKSESDEVRRLGFGNEE
jgi:hypothetical protein